MGEIHRATDAPHEAFAVHGSTAHLRLVARNGGAVGVALGAGLVPAALLAGTGDPTSGAALALGVLAVVAGGYLVGSRARLPLWSLDVQMVAVDVLLAVAGARGGLVHDAMPAVVLALATSLAVLRSRRASALHVLSLAAAYGYVLVRGPGVEAPGTRWVAVVAAMAWSAGFVRWLVEKAASVAVDDHGARLAAEETTEALAGANEVKRAFLARMSHELRTPLNAVLGFADVLRTGLAGPLTARQAEYADDIAASGRHLLSLVDDALDLAKVERGALELEVATVDVRALVADALRLVREPARGAGVALETSVAPGAGTVEGDRRRLQQVLTNLLANAVRHTPAGGTVTVAVRPAGGDSVEIDVRDTGTGIAPEDLNRIFEQFEQAAPRAGGAGLGLALARRYVEAHGGTLGVRSRRGKGSTFVLVLPRSRVWAEGREATPARRVDADAEAFLEPLSAASRLVGSRASAALLGASGAVAVVLSLATPGSWDTRVAAVGAGTVAVLAAVAVWRFHIAPAPPLADLGLVTLCVIIGGIVLAADAFADVVALSWMVLLLIVAGLWPWERLVLPIGASLACAAAVPWFDGVGWTTGSSRWAAFAGALGGQLVTGRHVGLFVRRSVQAERASRRHAEQVHDELVAATAHKQDFLANLSHELRAPLNAVIGFADVLADELAGPLEPKQLDYAREIGQAGRQLLSLIDDLLELARLDAGRLTVDRRPTPPGAAVAGAVAAAEPIGSARRVQIVSWVDPDLPDVDADPARLEEVVGRLLANAIKFTPDGGCVELRATAGHGVVRVSVQDTGIGVEPEQQRHVFDAFHQGTRPLPEHARGGAGLGLAVVRGLVDLHGGTVELDSEPGRGSTFTVTLPTAPAPATVAAEQ